MAHGTEHIIDLQATIVSTLSDFYSLQIVDIPRRRHSHSAQNSRPSPYITHSDRNSPHPPHFTTNTPYNPGNDTDADKASKPDPSRPKSQKTRALDVTTCTGRNALPPDMHILQPLWRLHHERGPG